MYAFRRFFRQFPEVLWPRLIKHLFLLGLCYLIFLGEELHKLSVSLLREIVFEYGCALPGDSRHRHQLRNPLRSIPAINNSTISRAGKNTDTRVAMPWRLTKPGRFLPRGKRHRRRLTRPANIAGGQPLSKPPRAAGGRVLKAPHLMEVQMVFPVQWISPPWIMENIPRRMTPDVGQAERKGAPRSTDTYPCWWSERPPPCIWDKPEARDPLRIRAQGLSLEGMAALSLLKFQATAPNRLTEVLENRALPTPPALFQHRGTQPMTNRVVRRWHSTAAARCAGARTVSGAQRQPLVPQRSEQTPVNKSRNTREALGPSRPLRGAAAIASARLVTPEESKGKEKCETASGSGPGGTGRLLKRTKLVSLLTKNASGPLRGNVPSEAKKDGLRSQSSPRPQHTARHQCATQRCDSTKNAVTVRVNHYEQDSEDPRSSARLGDAESKFSSIEKIVRDWSCGDSSQRPSASHRNLRQRSQQISSTPLNAADCARRDRLDKESRMAVSAKAAPAATAFLSKTVDADDDASPAGYPESDEAVDGESALRLWKKSLRNECSEAKVCFKPAEAQRRCSLPQAQHTQLNQELLYKKGPVALYSRSRPRTSDKAPNEFSRTAPLHRSAPSLPLHLMAHVK